MQALEKHDVMTVEPGQRNSTSWIDDGEKYAVIGLSVKLDDPVPLQEMTPHHWAFADAQFDIPAHWREWLGTIRTKEVENSNLFLLSKMRSQTPEKLRCRNCQIETACRALLCRASARKPVHASTQAGDACRLPPKR
jgi:hypothetical protein